MDLFDINDCLDQIVEGLDEATDVPPDVWMALNILRERLDDIQYRTLLSPMFLNMMQASDLQQQQAMAQPEQSEQPPSESPPQAITVKTP